LKKKPASFRKYPFSEPDATLTAKPKKAMAPETSSPDRARTVFERRAPTTAAKEGLPPDSEKRPPLKREVDHGDGKSKVPEGYVMVGGNLYLKRETVYEAVKNAQHNGPNSVGVMP